MFPLIKTIQDVYPAIRERDEFAVVKREDLPIITIDYRVNFDDTFPTPDTKDESLNNLYRIRRECRGLKFFHNGEIASRPYHKFFNVGERSETFPQNLIWKDYYIMDKLDGSMIDALVYDEKVYLGTKAGPTDVAKQAQAFAEKKTYYLDFCYDMIKSGKTPLFEWCSRQQRIVVDYPVERLVLTGARHIHSGEYLTYDQLKAVAEPYGVEVVNVWPDDPVSIDHFIKEIRQRENEEGYVIAWKSGYRAKIKNEWYSNLHKMASKMAWEKDVWFMILNNEIDDAKAFMEPDMIESLDEFSHKLHQACHDLAEEMKWVVIEAKDKTNGSRKRAALEYFQNLNPMKRPLFWSIWDEKDPMQVVLDYVMKHTATNSKLESIRPILGDIRWSPISYVEEE